MAGLASVEAASRRGTAKHDRVGWEDIARPARVVVMSMSSDKPKKKQKTLKARRSETRAAKKFGSSSVLRAEP